MNIEYIDFDSILRKTEELRIYSKSIVFIFIRLQPPFLHEYYSSFVYLEMKNLDIKNMNITL